MASKIRGVLRSFHYNTKYSPIRAERDIRRIMAWIALKPIRWRLEEKHNFGRKWYYGYLAGRKFWHIFCDGKWYRLYDSAGVFLTEKQNGDGYATLLEAKMEARRRTEMLLTRMIQ